MKAKKEAHTKSAFPSQGRLQNRRVIVRDSLIRYPPKKEKAAVRALSDNTRNGDSKSPRNPSRLKIRRSQPSSLLRCLARARSADNTVVDQCYPRRRGAPSPIAPAVPATEGNALYFVRRTPKKTLRCGKQKIRTKARSAWHGEK